MYSKILVPLDGSRFSEGVLPYVRFLARSLKTSVELLHVDDPTRLTPLSPPLPGAEYLQGVAASLSGAGEVQCRVEPGEPAGIIVDLAATQAGTLIAMTTHGNSPTQRWLLGSVADKVLHGSTSHLLLVRPAQGDTRGAASLTTILVPLDGSGLAESALPIAAELASRLNSKVVLVRVLQHFNVAPPDAILPLFGSSATKQKEIWAQARSAVDEYLATKVDEMRSQGVSQVSSMSIESIAGGAAAEIIDLARKTTDSLVVMSTHGRSGIGRWLLGSVTERVVRHGEGPVLVLRPFDYAHGPQTLKGP
jgi:nucleotide-binding universal stress UspA family protein